MSTTKTTSVKQKNTKTNKSLKMSGDKTINDVIEAISTSKKTIEALGLSTINLKDNTELVNKMVDALKINKVIKVLKCKNEIGPAGVSKIVDILKVNSTITDIYLDSCNIGDDGAKYLAEMLKVNKTIVCLSINENNIRFIIVNNT